MAYILYNPQVKARVKLGEKISGYTVKGFRITNPPNNEVGIVIVSREEKETVVFPSFLALKIIHENLLNTCRVFECVNGLPRDAIGKFLRMLIYQVAEVMRESEFKRCIERARKLALEKK